MAALTSDRNTQYSLGDLLSIPVEASTRIFAGSLVCINSSGYAVPADDAAGLLFAGIATAQADNRTGGAGALSAVVRRRGRYLLGFDGALSQAAAGAQVCAVDDQTVDAADDTTNDVAVGVIARIESSSQCWVDIDGAVLTGRAWTEAPTTTPAL